MGLGNSRGREVRSPEGSPDHMEEAGSPRTPAGASQSEMEAASRTACRAQVGRRDRHRLCGWRGSAIAQSHGWPRRGCLTEAVPRPRTGVCDHGGHRLPRAPWGWHRAQLRWATPVLPGWQLAVWEAVAVLSDTCDQQNWVLSRAPADAPRPVMRA